MGNSRQNNINYDSNEKNLPLFVGSHETQGFMNEIIKTSRERKKNEKEIKKWWFWLGFLGGIFIASLGIFFTFTTVYFIENSILEKPNFNNQKVICEKK
ncbi:hypothetical protein [Silvanigrella sp.]|jgi:hypothetical protein|uniref:hypothetical protein n=1 Tax=Silvanigrella sp. TaxID=2024976 RepID=UPI0037CA4711